MFFFVVVVLNLPAAITILYHNKMAKLPPKNPIRFRFKYDVAILSYSSIAGDSVGRRCSVKKRDGSKTHCMHKSLPLYTPVYTR